EHRGDCPVAWACDVLEVSESGYHARAGRTPSQAQQRRQRLVAAIEQIAAEFKGHYGSPQMTGELTARGFACTENTVARLMNTHGIRARAARRLVRTTDSRHSLPVADNLLGRDFDPGRPNAAWCRHHVHPDSGRLRSCTPWHPPPEQQSGYCEYSTLRKVK